MELFDKDQAATIKDAIEELSANFEGIKIGSTAVHDFLKVDMNFTIKRAVFHADKRNNEESVEERYRWATEIANSDVNFFRNCIFIDESGFHVNLKRTGAWGPKGKTPIIEVENSQAVSHTILGAISVYGVIHTSVRMPSLSTSQPVPVSVGKKKKKRKIDTRVAKKQQKSEGTTADHFYVFIKETLDVMDQFQYLKEAYLIMDNASIHKRPNITDLITKGGYNYIFLTPILARAQPDRAISVCNKE